MNLAYRWYAYKILHVIIFHAYDRVWYHILCRCYILKTACKGGGESALRFLPPAGIVFRKI